MSLRNTLLIAMTIGLLSAGIVWFKNRQREKEARYRSGHVMVAGAIRDVRPGSIHGRISLDTLHHRKQLYGIGPLEGLQGEIMLLDGIPFISQVDSAGQETVRTDWKVKAPVFVYARVADWQTVELPETGEAMLTFKSLEKILPQIAAASGLDTAKPFPFLLKTKGGIIDYRIVQVPDTSRGPKSHTFQLKKMEAMMLGFHSRRHEMIFTFPGSTTYIHVLSGDRKRAGDVFEFSVPRKEAQLLLPEDNR